MTMHYHGTPITPRSELLRLAGRCFCISYAQPQDVAICHQIGQSVMLDNGAFSAWRRGLAVDWPGYYRWTEVWLRHPTTWAVIPDVIDGTGEDNDRLLEQWPHGDRGAPVWHMHEPLDRLAQLCERWPRVCIGSSATYSVVRSPAWHRRMIEIWNSVDGLPWLHMLRGMSLAGSKYPFASLDSTDIGRNHNRPQNSVIKLAERWDSVQCPGHWTREPEALELSL
jgi:hypothetical protein